MSGSRKKQVRNLKNYKKETCLANGHAALGLAHQNIYRSKVLSSQRCK